MNMKDDYLEKLNIDCIYIRGKRIFIFESHHYALYPWALIKRDYEEDELNLLSFDYHTDTLNAFLYYTTKVSGGELNNGLEQRLIDEIDYRNDTLVVEAIKKLRNDEHIKAALGSGILDHALIITPSGHETPQSYEEENRIKNCFTKEALIQQIAGTYAITPKEKRTYPKSDIYMPDFECKSKSEILDDEFLQYHLSELSRISGLVTEAGMLSTKYVLDIDLDYFTNPEAVEPKNHRIFSELVQHAEAITIARESVCVDMCSKRKTNSEYLQNKLMELIEDSLLELSPVKL